MTNGFMVTPRGTTRERGEKKSPHTTSAKWENHYLKQDSLILSEAIFYDLV